ncbi:type IV secretion system protein [Coralloluteibacterium stylophorae]|uniref:Type IV secretion system protein n=1 Tax=Coralloluteibacterium stylophorae TaxID=1776034 RepID=A0A8J8B007_9GAMM|nr:type IV secretion system protein [Coralloluteibacterium stylophorae]MBS7458580.1 type IV secretion system protein [Coralloluteibacterium stylophorae]
MSGFDPTGFIQWAFFTIIFEMVNSQVESFQHDVLERSTAWVSGIALTLLTLWVLSQGFLIVTGRSRDSLMGLVVGSLRAFLIVIAASSMSFAGTDLTDFLTERLPREIHQVVAGNDEDVGDAIDDNLKIMGLIFAITDSLPTADSDETADDQRMVTSLTGIGIAGPSVVGGAMLLLYKLALVLFVSFGPLFILCLLFDQTKDLFKRWLLYGVGTMFAMAVLSFMVSVATQLVAVTAVTFVGAYAAAGGPSSFGNGLNSAAIQQGGIGLLMSVLMVLTPPMAAMFFNGTLGQFAASSSFGSVGRNGTGQVSDFQQDWVKKKGQQEDGGNRDMA